MLKFTKLGLVGVVVSAIGAFAGAAAAVGEGHAEESTLSPEASRLPKLLDLGSKECVPCKMMAPILEGLGEAYAGEFDVEFLDVGLRENAAKAHRYGIKLIPTQIFFDEEGKELWRHEGFLDKEQILATWRELGYSFTMMEAGDEPPPDSPAEPVPSSASQPIPAGSQPSNTVAQAYPALTSGVLANATLSDLPAGILLRAGDVTVDQAELDAEIAKAPAALQDQVRKNAFHLLEQEATRRLLLQEARKAVALEGKDVSGMLEDDLLRSLFASLGASVTVTEAEIAAFHAENHQRMGGQPLEVMREAIAKYLGHKKRQDTVTAYSRSLSERIDVDLDADWVRRQAALAMDNPVDKARTSGMPTLVDFGSKGCRPCDMLQPILVELRQKYDGQANIVFISVREQQVLASRYGVQSIPTLILFDNEGREVMRHTGFRPREELEQWLGDLEEK